MRKGKLYGLGVGPGDPELLTLKAVRLLREADVIAVPDKGTGEKTALRIVEQFVGGKELIFCPTPMLRDRSQWDRYHEEIADRICRILDAGKNVSFITLGDPTIYSTYIYVHKKVAARGYEAELVPGVTSFCAVAARLGVSLCEGDERLMVIPGSCELKDTMDIQANKVFMKSGKGILQLQQQLNQAGLLDGAAMVENCGMENERVWPRFGDMKENSGYFSVVVVKERG